MLTQIHLLGKEDKHTMRLTQNDYSATVAPTLVSQQLNRMIWVPPQETSRHLTTNLIKAAQDLLEAFLNDSRLLQYYYSYDTVIPGTGTPSYGFCGGTPGIKIDAKVYDIWGGIGGCYLDQVDMNAISPQTNMSPSSDQLLTYPDERRPAIRTIDLRASKQLKTDNVGIIKIHRKKQKLTWSTELPKLIAFLKCLPDNHVTICVSWACYFMTPYTRCYARFTGDQNWDKIRIYDLSDSGKIAKRLNTQSRIELSLLSEEICRNGHKIIPSLIEAFPKIRKSPGRSTILRHLTKHARTNDAAFNLALKALNDNSSVVRQAACAALAYSLRQDAVPALQNLLKHRDEWTAKFASAAIDAIQSKNHNYFFDWDHSGKVKWHP